MSRARSPDSGLPVDPRRRHARRGAEAGRGGHRVCDARRAGRGGSPHSGARVEARRWTDHELGLLRRAVGSAIAMARPARAPRRQLRHRPADAEPGGEPRLLPVDREHHPHELRVLLAATRLFVRSRPGATAPCRGRLPQRLRRGRLHLRRGGHLPVRARGERSQRAASGRSYDLSSARPTSRAGPKRSTAV